MQPFAYGRMFQSIGQQLVGVAVGWELYERTGDPWALGLVGLVQVVPALAFMLPAGNLADRFPRRNVVAWSMALWGLTSLGLTAVSWLDAPIWLTYLFLALGATARSFATPAMQTLLAQLLTPRDFARAYPWVVTTSQLASVSGPAAGGLLIALTGAASWSYLAAALSQLACVGLFGMLPAVPVAGRQPGRKGIAELFDGFRFIRRTPVYLAAITLDMFGVLLGGAVALLPIYARDILESGPFGLGLLRAAPAAGAILVALVLAQLPPWRRPGVALLAAMAIFGLATVGFGLSRDLVLSLVCLGVVGGCDSVSMVIRATLQQVLTPDWVRGRVAAVNFLFIGMSNELGAFESGVTAAWFGPVLAVVGGGVGTVAAVVAIALVCPALVAVGPLHTLRPREEPEPARSA